MSTFDKDTDVRELVLGCKSGDDSAFSELVQRYTPLIYKLVSDSGLDADTDELFSEGCVALHQAALGYDVDQDEVTFGLYAKACIYHRFVDVRRRSKARGELLELDDESVECEAGPDERLVARERLDALFLYARQVLSDYEYSVLLYHIQGYKTSAIAERLGKSSKSVDNAKARVFRRLRQVADSI
jgi:RNA polymerase sporulation-specific sigma factor